MEALCIRGTVTSQVLLVGWQPILVTMKTKPITQERSWVKLLRSRGLERPSSCLKCPSLKTFTLIYPFACSPEPLSDHVPDSKEEVKCSRSNRSWIWEQTLEWESREVSFMWPWASHPFQLTLLKKWMRAKVTDSFNIEGSWFIWACPLETGILTTCTSEPTWVMYMLKNGKCVHRKWG